MANGLDETPSSGIGLGRSPGAEVGQEVFVLVAYRDGSLTAAVHTSERRAMEAAIDLLADEGDDHAGGMAPEDRFARAQRLVADEGGLVKIISSPVFSP